MEKNTNKIQDNTDKIIEEEKKFMSREATIKDFKKYWRQILLGTVGFLALYTAVCTEDARDTLPEKQAQELVSEKTTLAMGATGMAAMLGAFIWAKKRGKGERGE